MRKWTKKLWVESRIRFRPADIKSILTKPNGYEQTT
jgi:hypothetical protein